MTELHKLKELEIGYNRGHCWDYDKYSPPAPHERLAWDLPPACVNEINSAQASAEKQIANLDLYVYEHDKIAKRGMKKCGVSPDAFIQMAIQLAYYKVSKVC